MLFRSLDRSVGELLGRTGDRDGVVVRHALDRLAGPLFTIAAAAIATATTSTAATTPTTAARRATTVVIASVVIVVAAAGRSHGLDGLVVGTRRLGLVAVATGTAAATTATTTPTAAARTAVAGTTLGVAVGFT